MIVLLYHRICPLDKLSSIKDDISVDPTIFESQIKYLKNRIQNFYDSIKLDCSKSDSVVITFDDGYKDNLDYAFPILKKYNVPAVIFICPDIITKKRKMWWDELSDLVIKTSKKTLFYFGSNFNLSDTANKKRSFKILARLLSGIENNMDCHLASLRKLLDVSDTDDDNLLLNWDEIKYLSDHGIYFGSHTLNHRRVSLCNSNEELVNEIKLSKSIIEEKTKKVVDLFAYPYGRETDYNLNAIQVVQESGYKFAFSAVVKGMFKNINIFEIPRIGMSRGDSFTHFKLKTSRLYHQGYYSIRKILGKEKVKSWE